MKRFTNYLTAFMLGVLTLFAMSCDNTEELVPTLPDDEYDVVLKVKEDSVANPNVNYNVTASTGTTIAAKVTFVNTEDDGMKRLYITRNIGGAGEEAYEPLENVDLRADGAIGLEDNQSDEFTFEFDLEVPGDIDNGTVVYTFWATHGNGDMRDVTKRLAAGPGTITLKYGNAQDPDQDDVELKTFSDVKLFAPRQDLQSSTFVSLVDGQVFEISDGAEYATLWDFGYYFTNQQGASLASTAAYEDSFVNLNTGQKFVDVDGIAETTELNEAFFAESDLDFDAASTVCDLDFSASANQKITALAVGDVIQFVDNYGKKGLIKVQEIFKGADNSGTASDAYILLDIKVQP